jgi:hemolysin-activating ACP:hemolysin acyltransferase
MAIKEPVRAATFVEAPAAQAIRHLESRLALASPAVSSVRPWKAGNETATLPWSAPVGHHQPRAVDLPASTSASRRPLDEEDANLDRKIRGICQGCLPRELK